MAWTLISILCSPSSFRVPQVLQIVTIATTDIALAKDESFLLKYAQYLQDSELALALESALNQMHELATLDLVLVRTLDLALERALVLELGLELGLELTRRLKLTQDPDSDMNVATCRRAGAGVGA